MIAQATLRDIEADTVVAEFKTDSKQIIENELDYGTLDIKRDITDEGTVVYKGIANFKKYNYS